MVKNWVFLLKRTGFKNDFYIKRVGKVTRGTEKSIPNFLTLIDN